MTAMQAHSTAIRNHHADKAAVTFSAEALISGRAILIDLVTTSPSE